MQGTRFLLAGQIDPQQIPSAFSPPMNDDLHLIA
jgi:hypothetical protein